MWRVGWKEGVRSTAKSRKCGNHFYFKKPRERDMYTIQHFFPSDHQIWYSIAHVSCHLPPNHRLVIRDDDASSKFGALPLLTFLAATF